MVEPATTARAAMIRLRPLAVLALLLTLPACDTNVQQDEFFLESELPPNGITRTNEAGEVLEEDPDDWRVAPVFRGAVEVEPAYPNPVVRTGLVTLIVQDTFDDAIVGGIYVSGFDDAGRPVRLADDLGAGPTYILTFNPAQLSASGGEGQLFRVRVFTTDFRLITYGDVQVQ